MNFSVTVDQMGKGGWASDDSRPNGEIYNHAELRAELEALGCNFATRSDTEARLYAFALWSLWPVIVARDRHKAAGW